MVELTDNLVLLLEGIVGRWFTAIKQCHQHLQTFLYVVIVVDAPVLFQKLELMQSIFDADCSGDGDMGDFIMDGAVQGITGNLDTTIPVVSNPFRPALAVIPLIPQDMVTVSFLHRFPLSAVSS